ncbi:hypothetical protein BH10PSE17_BH10PSE17_11220 [soil metagenome]
MTTLRRLKLISICALASAAPLAMAEPPTVAQYIASISYDAPKRVVDYCSTAVPALKTPMETELSKFGDELEFAAAAAVDNLGMKLNDPVPPEMTGALNDVNGSLVERAKQTKAEDYCPALLQKLKTTTAESLRMAIETEFADNEAEAKAKPAAAKP